MCILKFDFSCKFYNSYLSSVMHHVNSLSENSEIFCMHVVTVSSIMILNQLKQLQEISVRLGIQSGFHNVIHM